MKQTGFIIRQYGRTELAQMYSPDIAPESAWRKLRRWIEHYPGLTEQLHSLGYVSGARCFTPLQVQAIINALGEP